MSVQKAGISILVWDKWTWRAKSIPRDGESLDNDKIFNSEKDRAIITLN